MNEKTECNRECFRYNIVFSMIFFFDNIKRSQFHKNVFSFTSKTPVKLMSRTYTEMFVLNAVHVLSVSFELKYLSELHNIISESICETLCYICRYLCKTTYHSEISDPTDYTIVYKIYRTYMYINCRLRFGKKCRLKSPHVGT